MSYTVSIPYNIKFKFNVLKSFLFLSLQFMAGSQVDMEQVHMSIRPLLLKLGDYRSLNLQLIQVGGRAHALKGQCPRFFVLI